MVVTLDILKKEVTLSMEQIHTVLEVMVDEDMLVIPLMVNLVMGVLLLLNLSNAS